MLKSATAKRSSQIKTCKHPLDLSNQEVSSDLEELSCPMLGEEARLQGWEEEVEITCAHNSLKNVGCEGGLE